MMVTEPMGQYKLNSWIWTIFSFVLHMMTWWSVLVMVPTVFDKTQARARKSIFCLKSYKNVAVNHLELIKDKLKILFGGENLRTETSVKLEWKFMTLAIIKLYIFIRFNSYPSIFSLLKTQLFYTFALKICVIT